MKQELHISEITCKNCLCNPGYPGKWEMIPEKPLLPSRGDLLKVMERRKCSLLKEGLANWSIRVKRKSQRECHYQYQTPWQGTLVGEDTGSSFGNLNKPRVKSDEERAKALTIKQSNKQKNLNIFSGDIWVLCRSRFR